MKQIILILFTLSTFLFARERSNPELFFSDSTYEATCTLVCKNNALDSRQLLDILFAYDHVKEYMAKFNLTMTKKMEDSTTSRIELRYNYLIAHMTMDLVRIKKVDQNMVSFVMENYYRSKRILPIVQSTSGTYYIRKEAEEWLISYKTIVTLDKTIGPVYRSVIKRETRRYLDDLKEYIETVTPPGTASE